MASNGQVEAFLLAGLDVDLVRTHEQRTLFDPPLIGSVLWWMSHCLSDLVLPWNLLGVFGSHLFLVLCGSK